MNLKSLFLYNIGPFRGRYPINFQSTNGGNGFAFFAENNRGKTSIYNAMRWCLFGQVSERAKTIAGKRYDGGTIPMVGDGEILMNSTAYEEDSTQEMSVMLLAEGNRGTIQITRTARSTTTFARTDEEMEMTLDVKIGDEPIMRGSEGQEAIESFFPKELERFFFIDGEALEEYTEMMRSSALEGLKEEVNAVLGIPALLRGEDDLTTIRRRLKSKIDSATKADLASSKALDDLNRQRGVLKSKIKTSEEIKSKLETVMNKLEETKEQMQAHKELAPVVEELKLLKQQIDLKKAYLNDAASEKLDESKIAWKVLLWKKSQKLHDELVAIQERASLRERSIQQTKDSIRELEVLLKETGGLCPECKQPHPEIEQYRAGKQIELDERKSILARLEDDVPMAMDELTIRLGALKKLKPQDDSEMRIIKANEKWKKLVNELASLEERYERLDAKLTEDAKANVEELGERKGRQEATVAKRESEWRNAHREVEQAELEMRRLERLTGKSTSNKGDHELDDIISSLIVTVKDTITSYREQARKNVEKRATEVFGKLNNAPEVYTGIKVDKDFKTSILNSKGKAARKPSSGAVSIMTMSVIDALRHVSGLDLPVFLDTPGRSLDQHHKSKLLEYFWQTDRHQFLIFAHSGEYAVDETVSQFEGRLARAYTISLPRDHRSCYQPECLSDDVDHDVYNKKNTCNACGFEWDLTSQETLVLEVPL